MAANQHSKTLRWVYNPSKNMKTIKDINVAIGSNRIVDLLDYVKPEVISKSLASGSLKTMFAEGELMWSADGKPPAGLKPKYWLSTKPIPSRVAVSAVGKESEKFFVEAIEEEWAHNPMKATEQENAKNTEDLINSDLMDQFDDPLDRKW